MASLNGIIGMGTKQPLFSFGVITDVQYADIPDGHSFLGVPRYYRHSILALQRAVRKWNQIGKLQFTLHFGDIVDGLCPKEESRTAVLNVIKGFDEFNGPVYHMLGNHCLYNLPRSDLISLLKIPSPNGVHIMILAPYQITDLLCWMDMTSVLLGGLKIIPTV